MASQRSGELQYISHAGGPYRPDDWRCECGRMNIAVSNRCIICSMPQRIPMKPVQVGWECGCLVQIKGVSEPKINPNSVISCGKCARNKYSASQVHQVGQVGQTKPSRFTPKIKPPSTVTDTVMELSYASPNPPNPPNPPNSPAQQPDAMDVEPTEPVKSVGFAEPEPESVKPAQPIMPRCKCGEFEPGNTNHCDRCGMYCGKEPDDDREQIESDADSWMCDRCDMQNPPTTDVCRICVISRKKPQTNLYS